MLFEKHANVAYFACVNCLWCYHLNTSCPIPLKGWQKVCFFEHLIVHESIIGIAKSFLWKFFYFYIFTLLFFYVERLSSTSFVHKVWSMTLLKLQTVRRNVPNGPKKTVWEVWVMTGKNIYTASFDTGNQSFRCQEFSGLHLITNKLLVPILLYLANVQVLRETHIQVQMAPCCGFMMSINSQIGRMIRIAFDFYFSALINKYLLFIVQCCKSCQL